MDIAVLLLVILSLGILFVAIWIFFRMSDSGQFDDPVSPALAILMDNDTPKAPAQDVAASSHAPETSDETSNRHL